MALHDEAEIHALLQGRREELIEHLDRLDSTCEMALRMAPSSPPRTPLAASSKPQSPLAARWDGSCTAIPSSPARERQCNCHPNGIETTSKPQSPLAYIEQRRLHYQRADETAERDKSMVEQVVERLHGCYRQWRKLQASASYAIRLAFLVEREREAAFRSRLEDIGGTERLWQCAILGPWPPYSFV
jgi:hypothetical protein